MDRSEAPATIFIVDDDRGLLRLIEKALRREGFATVTAASGQEAIEWLSRNRPDLMLLDLKLQDIEAKDLIHHLSQLNRLVPFIIITGQGDERVAVEMMKRGALDYLVKDVRFQEFVPAVVQRALQQTEKDRRLVTAEQDRKRLERQIAEISHQEQRRMGQDLHDGLCQHLAGIELMSQVLEQNLEKKGRPEAVQAAKIAEHVREAIAQTRMLARGLAPIELESNGLMSALHELANNTERLFHVTCRFECDPPVLLHDYAAATHVYRIAQEAISNAIKHGKPNRILIDLASEGPLGRLSITDDGAGFPKTPGPNAGMGLQIMNYRASTISGKLEVCPAPKKGTRVVCTFKIGS
ncbi:MAG: response regulator [Verrucomicrobia bacterium]|nr:response regulator [Verrucomicrobiota bacterium]